MNLELDEADGCYPSEASVQAIADWTPPPGSKGAECLAPLLEAIQEIWHWGSDWCGNPRPGIYTFATGGWSGNESLLDALRANVYTMMGDDIYLRGGLYCIAITPEAKKEMDEIQAYVRSFAWSKTPLEIPVIPRNKD